MGAFEDVISSRRTFAYPSNLATYLAERSAAMGAPAVPAAFQAKDAVQTFAAVETATDGTYTLTVRVNLPTGPIQFTTGNLNHDDNAATVEAAIDTASPASVPNGAISVSGGPLDTNDLVLTFDGNAVDEIDHPAATIASALTDGMDPVGDAEYTAAHTTHGQPARPVWAVLLALGVIADTTPPPQYAMVNATPGPNYLRVGPHIVQALAAEAAFQDDNSDSYAAIVSVLGDEGNRAPLVQP